MASVSSCRERIIFAYDGKRPTSGSMPRALLSDRKRFFGRGVRLSPATSEIPVHCCQRRSDSAGTLWRLPALSGRKEGATLGQYGLNFLGHTWHTMVKTMSSDAERRRQSQKLDLGSDWGLKLVPMKLEWLVIACHHRAVNRSPLLAHTARQAIQVRLW